MGVLKSIRRAPGIRLAFALASQVVDPVRGSAFRPCGEAGLPRNYDRGEPVSLGRGEELSIASLAGIIAARVGFGGTIVWDRTKPNEQPRRMLDVTRALNEFGFRARTSFAEGLGWMVDRFMENRVAEARA